MNGNLIEWNYFMMETHQSWSTTEAELKWLPFFPHQSHQLPHFLTSPINFHINTDQMSIFETALRFGVTCMDKHGWSWSCGEAIIVIFSRLSTHDGSNIVHHWLFVVTMNYNWSHIIILLSRKLWLKTILHLRNAGTNGKTTL